MPAEELGSPTPSVLDAHGVGMGLGDSRWGRALRPHAA